MQLLTSLRNVYFNALAYVVSKVDELCKECFAQQEIADISIKNKNKYFTLSALAFFLLNTNWQRQLLGVIIAYLFFKYLAKILPSMWGYVRESDIKLKIFSLMSAIGIILAEWNWFYAGTSKKWHRVLDFFHASNYVDIPFYLGILFAIGALYFVYCALLVFWKQFLTLLKQCALLKKIPVSEIIIYMTLMLITCWEAYTVFIHTDIFYGVRHNVDIIYTSDSPSLVSSNVYVSLSNIENDIRQPLFALFAAPFTGIAYFAAYGLSLSESVRAILVNCTQIAMLIFTNYMLARMLHLPLVKRICFVILSSCTYTYMLFALMMEQYIIGYFWLILCVYCIINNITSRLAFWGAGGTLLTSLVLAPLVSGRGLQASWKECLAESKKYLLEFLLLVVAFSRVDVILKLKSKAEFFISSFSGVGVSFQDKIYQYLEFVHNYFFAPIAGIKLGEAASWQLAQGDGYNLAGTLILLLSLIRVLLNRKNKVSRIAGLWIAFSFFMLVCIGWGTKENGLILYGLYFGWAFFVLLFQFLEKIEESLSVNFIIPIFTLIGAAALIKTNIQGILEMVEFAVGYYPL